MPIVAGVPVKSFSAAKMRLAAAIPPDARIALSQGMARRTCALLAEVGAGPLVLAADTEVAQWARTFAYEVVLDEGLDLNQAAAAVVEFASGQPWLLLHADLPLLDSEVVAQLLAALEDGRSVIAPSRDGGTPAIGGSVGAFDFGYGPSSFRGHLRRLAASDPKVLVDPRLAIDLDDPSDLEVVRRRVPWMATILDSLATS
ncbi:MAG TPA: 2-phospho-L-lactate guanylyltransferase [Acidimicrobiia bacterium]|nr:2-phospho-L-lactate guanylyltransferase [Acidimicrobiia bacterium]